MALPVIAVVGHRLDHLDFIPPFPAGEIGQRNSGWQAVRPVRCRWLNGVLRTGSRSESGVEQGGF